MALHDYKCTGCGYIQRDVNVPCRIGASGMKMFHSGCPRVNPVAYAAFGLPGPPMEWIPQIGAMDFGPAGGAGFKSFTIEEEVRGRSQRIDIDSVSKLRKVEREFEVHARNGEARPLVWRDYAQTKSNQDVHTLSSAPGDPHNVTPEVQRVVGKTVTASRGTAVTAKHGTI